MNAIVVANLLCMLIYFVLALLLAIHSERRPTALLLIAACVTTGLWGLAVTLQTGLGAHLGPTSGVLEVLRSALWVGFLGLAYRAGLPDGASTRELRWLLLPGGAICLGLVGLELYIGTLASGSAEGSFSLAHVFGHLLLTIAGLMMAEALLRQAPAESRWRIKYLCIGVGGLLVYDLFAYSEALLFRRIDPVLDASRGAVCAIAAPLIAIAAARNPTWSVQLNLSRRAVFHSAVLTGVGIYLMGLAGAGAALRMLGGDWGRLLQATFLFAALLLLVVLLFSGTVRSTLKVRISKYLFTYRHDYKEQWQRFADALCSPDRAASLRERALQAVAEIVESPKGGLWLRESDAFSLVARMRLPEAAADEPTDGRLAEELDAHRNRILELNAREDGGSPPPWIPQWLRRWEAGWLVLPLVHRDELIGFIVLARSAGRHELDREDEELLRIVARQAASYLVEEQTTRALVEARRFDDLSRHLAFIAHDLRNLANELALMLSNARRHIQNPEFQRDLLATMEDSVAGMQRLLDGLRGGTGAPETPGPTDLARLIGSSLRGRLPEKPEVRLDLDGKAPLRVAGDPDRLVAMSGHLIRNAIEATGPGGHVTVRLRRVGDEALFEVVDDGPGMLPEYARERLLHPFGSGKHTGLGLGLFECREIARELGGGLAIESEPGCGTVVRVRLPLAASEGDDPQHERLHGRG